MKDESLILLHVRKRWGESLDFTTCMNVERSKAFEMVKTPDVLAAEKKSEVIFLT